MKALVKETFKTSSGLEVIQGTPVYILPASWIVGIFLFQIGDDFSETSSVYMTPENYFEERRKDGIQEDVV